MTLTRVGATELLYQYGDHIAGLTLEVGAGRDPYRSLIESRASRIFTLDFEPKYGPDVVGDAHHIPFREGAFHTVIASQVLEHLVDPALAVSEFSRVLKEGGIVICLVPFLFPLHGVPHDYYRFTQWGLQALFEPHFHISLIRPYGSRMATIFDLLTTATASSSIIRKVVRLARRGLGPSTAKGKRWPRTGRWLLNLNPGEHPLGYLVVAKAR